jgi:hypothetical protein
MPENNIHLNETVLKDQLNELVRGTVEETLNRLLDEEAEQGHTTESCKLRLER